METCQNLENVQKTNLKNFHTQFDHLSVVPEENSAESSEKNSNRASLPNDTWTCGAECDVIKPDQSYPEYENKPNVEHLPTNFFAPIADGCEDYSQIGYLPEAFPTFPNYQQTAQHFRRNNETSELQDEKNFYPNMVLVPKDAPRAPRSIEPIDKSATDLIVKTDNQHFLSTPSRSTFSNGGNLEELLNDIEAISQDILKISSSQNALHALNYPQDNIEPYNQPVPGANSFHPDGNDIVTKIQNSDATYLQNSKVDNLEFPDADGNDQKPYKSEISLVLMPTPMPLIGFDKYRNIQRSGESIASRSLENMSASNQSLRIMPEVEKNVVITSGTSTFFPGNIPLSLAQQQHCDGKTPVLRITPSNSATAIGEKRIALNNLPMEAGIEQTNPFFFGNLQDSYSNSSYFTRYNPDNVCANSNNSDDSKTPKPQKTESEMCNSKSNLLEIGACSDQLSSENEENLKLKAPRAVEKEPAIETPEPAKIDNAKSPKLSIRRKVSIHFKGKKDKTPKTKTLDAIEVAKPKPAEKKHSIFDLKFDRKQPPKAPSVESKKSEPPLEPKTPTSSDSKASKTSEQKSSSSETKSPEIKHDRTMSLPNCNAKPDARALEKKTRKSISVSPDRRHVHMKEEGGKKCHKKHKKGERSRTRRSSVSTDRILRERSFSVCTDRSNILDHRLGLGFGSSYLYDDYNSDRERTNSLSSCDTVKTRKMSNISNLPLNGKIPWCACWGNGCL